MLYCTVLYTFTMLYCTVLYTFTMLYCTVLYTFTILYYNIYFYYNIVYYIICWQCNMLYTLLMIQCTICPVDNISTQCNSEATNDQQHDNIKICNNYCKQFIRYFSKNILMKCNNETTRYTYIKKIQITLVCNVTREKNSCNCSLEKL